MQSTSCAWSGWCSPTSEWSSNVQLDLSGPTTLRFEPVPFALQPGLYAIAVAFGCWDNRQERGAGTLTVLIRHPGEQALRPAGADEILRSAAAKP